nr:MAK10-like protein [Tanacetum cinerariifolium]
MLIPPQDEPLTNWSVNDPRDFAKSIKAIALPQDVLSTSDRRLINLENQVQRLMEAHLALTQPTQVNKITTSYKICSGPQDTQYFMGDAEQAFVDYASSRTDEAGGRDMHVFVGNVSYIMYFTILENIEANIDPSLSHAVFGQPFVEIVFLAINMKHGLMTFTDGIKEVTFKTPYKDPKRSELSSEGHHLLLSRVILSEDDYNRRCRKPSNLEDRIYRDTIKLGPEYVTGIGDEREVA